MRIKALSLLMITLLVAITSLPTQARQTPQPLPKLTNRQLENLNIQPEDVPPAFANTGEDYGRRPQSQADSFRNSGQTELADTYDAIINDYGWTQMLGTSYTTCNADPSISLIGSEVSQFTDPTRTSEFIDNATVTDFFLQLSDSFNPASEVHGWWRSWALAEPTCFPREDRYVLTFDYLGLLITVFLHMSHDGDAELAQNTLLEMANGIVGRVNELAGPDLQPTPMALTGGVMPIVRGTPRPAGGTVPTFDDLEAVVPETADLLAALSIPDVPLQYDPRSSAQLTREALVDLYNRAGFTTLEDIYSTLGVETGLIGNMLSSWNTSECPTPPVYLLETHFTIFETPEGAVTFMNDPRYAAVWTSVGGTYVDYPVGDRPGKLLTLSNIDHTCGPTSILNLYVPHGHVLLIVGVTVPVNTETQAAQGLVDFANFMIQRLDAAGIQ